MTDDARTALAAVVLVLLTAAIIALVLRTLRRKEATSTAALPDLPSVPEDLDTLGAARTAEMEGIYVSSTGAGDWLDRVPGHGLGRRSPALVQVRDGGVVVRRQGERDLLVPAEDLLGAHRAPGIAGKVVGGEGLVVVRWTLHGPGPAVLADGVGATPAAGAAVAAAAAAAAGGTDATGAARTLDTGLRLRHARDRDALTAAVEALVAGRPSGPVTDPSEPDDDDTDHPTDRSTPEEPR